MNFESPQPVPPSEEKPDDFSGKFKKTAALGAVVVAATFAGEACSPEQKTDTAGKSSSHEEKARVHPETQKSRIREGYEIQKKQGQHEAKMIVENMKVLEQAGRLSSLDLSNNNFLKYYYQGLNGERNPGIFGVAQQMRVLEIAKKKGIEIDLSRGLHMEIDGGIVPLSAKVNGVAVPIADSDYTSRELETVGFIRQMNTQPSAVDTTASGKNQAPGLRGSKAVDLNDF